MVSSIQFLQNRAANLNRVGFAAEKENTEAPQPKALEEQIKDAFVKSKQSQVIPESPKEVKAEEPPVVPELPKEDAVSLEPQTVVQESHKEEDIKPEQPPVIPETTKEEILKQRRLAHNRIGLGMIAGALFSTGHQFLKETTLLTHVSRIAGGAVIGGGLMAAVNYFTKSVSRKTHQEKQKESVK